MVRTVPLSIIRSFSLYTQQWYMSYGLRPGSGWNWVPFLPDPSGPTTCRTRHFGRVWQVVQKRRKGITTTRCVRAQKSAVLMLALLPRIRFNLHFISFWWKQKRAYIAIIYDVMWRCQAISADDMKTQGLECYVYDVNVLNLTNPLYERISCFDSFLKLSSHQLWGLVTFAFLCYETMAASNAKLATLSD